MRHHVKPEAARVANRRAADLAHVVLFRRMISQHVFVEGLDRGKCSVAKPTGRFDVIEIVGLSVQSQIVLLDVSLRTLIAFELHPFVSHPRVSSARRLQGELFTAHLRMGT